MFNKILVPVDLAEIEIAAPAIAAACELAVLSNGLLRLINVQSLLPVTLMDYVPPDYDAQQKGNAEKGLARMVSTVNLPAERISTSVHVGGIYPEILSEAENWGADLIVIGSHRPAMSRFLLGSNAKTIVRHATCSVLVVRK